MAHIHATGFYMVGVLSGSVSGTSSGVGTCSVVLVGTGELVGEITIVSNLLSIEYGLLYNWYAATDSKYIANTGWHVPSKEDWTTLVNYADPTTIGGYPTLDNNIAATLLKETGTTHWNETNEDVTNELQLNLRGSAVRYDTGGFGSIQDSGPLTTSTELNSTMCWAVDVEPEWDGVSLWSYVPYKKVGQAIRLVKDSTTLSHGQTSTYTGNDGKTYRTICIGTQEWLADNLCETKYRNGDAIPEVTGDSAWYALTTGALCAWMNNWSYAYTTEIGVQVTGILSARGTLQGTSNGVTDIASVMEGTGALVGEAVVGAGGEVIIDFEDYETGALIGQNGWIASGYGPVQVVEESGNNLICGNTQGGALYPISNYECKITMKVISGGDYMALYTGCTETSSVSTIYFNFDQWGSTPWLQVMFNKASETDAEATRSSSYDAGDVVGFEVFPNGTLKMYVNGEVDTAWGSSNNPTYMTGTGGEYTFVSSPDWPAGDVYMGVDMGSTSAKIDDITMGAEMVMVTGTLTAIMPSIEGSSSGVTSIAAVLEGVGELVGESTIVSNLLSVEYGLMYNWYAASDVREIAASGWHVPTKTDIDALIAYVGSADFGDDMKEVGTNYWLYANGDNLFGFNMRGAGYRDRLTGVFYGFQNEGSLWSSTKPYYPLGLQFRVTASYQFIQFYQNTGFSIRLIKDTTNLSHGDKGTYTGNDGKTYRTICINNQEWLSESLCETKYRNGESIPEVTGNSAWAALTTGALCAYQNNWNNAYTEAGVQVMGVLLVKGTLQGATDGVTNIASVLEGVVEEPTGFSAATVSDVRIDLAWTNGATYDSIKVERSTNGTDYTEIDSISGSSVSYQATGLTTNLQYWFRIRGIISSTYSEYSTADDDWTATKLGWNGYGSARTSISNFYFTTVNTTVSISGGLFYDYTTGGTGSSSYVVTKDTPSNNKYLEVTSGTAYMYVFHKGNWIQWGVMTAMGGGSIAWNNSSTSAPRANFTLAALPDTLVNVYLGNATYPGTVTGSPSDLPSSLEKAGLGSGIILSGNISGLPSGLQWLYLPGNGCTLSGDMSGLPSSLTRFYTLTGWTSFTGTLSSMPSGMVYFHFGATNTISGNVNTLPDTAWEYFLITGSTTITGDVSLFYGSDSVLQYLSVSGSNTLSGNVSDWNAPAVANPQISIYGNNTITGDIANIPEFYTISISGKNTLYGNICDIPDSTFTIYFGGSNTISGDISGISSGAVWNSLSISGNNTITGDIQYFPSSLTGITVSGYHTLSGNVDDLSQTGSVGINFGGLGASTISGNIANIPALCNSFTITCENTITGDFTTMPSTVTYLYVAGSNTISGDVTNYPTKITQCILYGSNTVTGPLSGFARCTTMMRIQMYGLNTLYGDLNDILNTVTYVLIGGNNTISDYTRPVGGKTWNANITGFSVVPVSGGLDSTELDNLLIDLAASTTGTATITYTFTGTNAPRTAASNAAVATLATKNKTVVTNPNLRTGLNQKGVASVTGVMTKAMFRSGTANGVASTAGVMRQAMYGAGTSDGVTSTSANLIEKP